MKAPTLILLLALLTPSGYAQAACIDNADDFLKDKVRALPSGGFNLANNGGSGPDGTGQYRAPQFSSGPIGEPHAGALKTAFLVAPEWFKSALCNLPTYILLDEGNLSDSNLAAWWFHEVENQGQNKYVGISQNLINQSTSLSTYESEILWDLLGANSAEPGPRYSSAPDDLTRTLLSALSHEIGHLSYFIHCEKDAFNAPQKCRDFQNESWKDKGLKPVIHPFGKPLRRSRPIDPNSAYLRVVADYVEDPDTPRLLGLVYGVGQNSRKEWGTLLSTVAVDEDFAETYKLMVLRSSNVTQLTIRPVFSSSAVNVMTNLCGATRLKTKKDHIEGMLSISPTVC